MAKKKVRVSRNVEIIIDEDEIQQLLRGPTGPVVRLVETSAKLVVAEAKRRAPVDTGKLRSSISYKLSILKTRVKAVVRPLRTKYAIYVHEGTGLYGPTRRVIRPKKARALRFKVKGGSGYVFAAFVRGQRPQKFLIDALIFALVGAEWSLIFKDSLQGTD